MIARLLIVFAALALAGQASANEAPPQQKAVGQYVDISPVAVPIVAQGKLINYVFVASRLELSPTADTIKWRSREPFFRDALVRAAHRTPFTNPKDYTSIDVPRFQAVLLREARAIAGASEVKSVTLVSQTPKQRLGIPKPGMVGGRVEIRP